MASFFTPPSLFAAALLLSAAPVFGAVDFAKQVQPVMEKKCYNCHRAAHEEEGKMKKPKGGIELDSLVGIQKGNDDGKILEPGQPDKSRMYVSTTLPKDDDKFMPPKGDPLTEEEKAMLKTWIQEGANFGEWKAATKAAPVAGATADSPVAHVAVERVDPYAALAKDLKPAEPDVFKKIESAGGRALPLAQNNPLLRVDFLMTRLNTTDTALAPLEAAKDQITQLELGETKITDAGLANVGKLTRLTRLDLHKTEVGDAGLAHLTGLENLWYLNLYGTKVTDAGLKSLAGLKKLQNIYLWQSQVTEAGVNELQKELPTAKIIWK